MLRILDHKAGGFYKENQLKLIGCYGFQTYTKQRNWKGVHKWYYLMIKLSKVCGKMVQKQQCIVTATHQAVRPS